MPKLIIQQPDGDRTVELQDGANVVGRSSKNQVPVNDTNISREHCEIVVSGAEATLVDKGSMNGTLLNGTRVWERKLEPGDKIQIGQSVLWFEVKKTDPQPSEPKTQRKTSPPKPPSGSTPAAPSKKTDVRKTAASLVKDYAAWTRSGFNARILLPLAAILGIVLLLAAVVKFFPRGATAPEEDRDNLLRGAGTFEEAAPGKPGDWTLRPAGKSSLLVGDSAARSGKRALSLLKSSEVSDSIVEAEYREKIPVGLHRSFEVSAWTRWGDFTGAVALRVAWLREGVPLLEECSVPVGKSGEWTNLKDVFTPPSGAREFRVGMLALGRGGTVHFDDVRVAAKLGGEARESIGAAGFDLVLSRSGAISVLRGNRVIVSGLHFRLENDLEGASTQLVQPAKAAREEGRVVLTGSVAHPVHGGSIPYEISIYTATQDELGIGYEFKGSDVARVKRLVLLAALPGAKIRSAEAAATQLDFESGEAYQFGYLGRTVQTELREGTRIALVFPAGDSEGKVTAALRLRNRTSNRARKDPLEAAREAEAERPSRSLEILRAAQGDSSVDETTMRNLAAMIQKLEAREVEEWRTAEAGALAAELVGTTALLEAATGELDRYEGRWAGEPYSAKSKAWRSRLASLVQEKSGPDRATRLIELAQKHLEEGRRSLGEWILVGVAAAYSKSEAGEKARNLLAQLRSGS